MEYYILLVVLIMLSAFFSSSETAFLTLQRLKLEHYVREGRPGAQAVSRLLEHPSRLLSAILIGNNLVNTGAAIVGGIIAQRIVSGGLGALAAALTVTALLVIFGEVSPKTVALNHSFGLSRVYALPMSIWTRLTRPLSSLLELISRGIVRMFGGEEPGGGVSISEAELRMMIGLSSEAGEVEEAEAELLHRVFHFGDRHVHEVMVPRPEAVMLDRNATVADFYATYLRSPHSRFPLFDESPDRVVGILGIKDVLSALSRGDVTGASPIQPLARDGLFVPETKLIGELFREMQATGNQMAIAVDEFGGTAGIVTLEQLLEEMVGQVRDELGVSEEEITLIDENTTEVDGALSVEEARDELGIDIPEGPYDTIAGYVLSLLGHIPAEGEAVSVDHHRITVAEMRNLKIELLRVTRV
jgi:putative hemolysin